MSIARAFPLLALAALLLAACARHSGVSKCNLASNGLAAAKPLTMWKPPANCGMHGDEHPKLLRSEDDVSAYLSCNAGVHSGVDFKSYSLVILTLHDFPARAGDEVVDDGKTVTIIHDQMQPCGHYAPHPGPDYTLAFLVPAGDRTFADTVCNVDVSCP
jgi:hypothetical protein